jgi:hypothetical protein
MRAHEHLPDPVEAPARVLDAVAAQASAVGRAGDVG